MGGSLPLRLPASKQRLVSSSLLHHRGIVPPPPACVRTSMVSAEGAPWNCHAPLAHAQLARGHESRGQQGTNKDAWGLRGTTWALSWRWSLGAQKLAGAVAVRHIPPCPRRVAVFCTWQQSPKQSRILPHPPPRLHQTAGAQVTREPAPSIVARRHGSYSDPDTHAVCAHRTGRAKVPQPRHPERLRQEGPERRSTPLLALPSASRAPTLRLAAHRRRSFPSFASHTTILDLWPSAPASQAHPGNNSLFIRPAHTASSVSPPFFKTLQARRHRAGVAVQGSTTGTLRPLPPERAVTLSNSLQSPSPAQGANKAVGPMTTVCARS